MNEINDSDIIYGCPVIDCETLREYCRERQKLIQEGIIPAPVRISDDPELLQMLRDLSKPEFRHIVIY